MHGISPHDRGRAIDWGKTSADYADWRPDYPTEFYARLAALGVGRQGQKILDLATGVGFLARNFARRGAIVTAIDISAEQIAEARRRAEAEGLSIDFAVARAEKTGLQSASCDAITASQCWLYFDKVRAIAEVKRLLQPEGVLVTSHFCWLPQQDEIARASEALVLRHNPDWTAAGWSGTIPPMPDWAAGHFDLVAMFQFDAPVPFTRESWRGRLRACRGVGATLSADEVAAFDREHDELLRCIAGDEFTVLHRVDAHVLRPRPAGSGGRV